MADSKSRRSVSSRSIPRNRISRSAEVREQKEKQRLRGLERHLIARPAQGGDLRFHLVYPNHYWVGMSNLGFQAVYGLLAAEPGVVVERGFLPEKSEKTPEQLRTFEGSRLISDCDLLGFSLSFETDYPHLFQILNSARLLSQNPLERAKRADESAFGAPLLIAGGTAVTLNPEPVADFLDLVLIGEAEEFLPELVSVYRQAKQEGCSREELLLRLSRLEGVYVPRFFSAVFSSKGAIAKFEQDSRVQRPKRRFVKDISKYPTYTRVLTPETEFRSMFLTETGRGCEMGCRFCVAGYIYRPIRKRSEESLAETVKIGLTQSNAIGFVGAAVSSHRSIAKLASGVAQAGGRASLSSLMAQKVSPELSASLSESEYKTVALAPEAGSERLRRAAGKRNKDEQYINAVTQLARSGIRGFKLYFIVGLPTETEQDIDAIAKLSIAIRDVAVEISRPSGKLAWVTLSVNPFVPKASTPFQWEPMLMQKELEQKIARIKALVRRVPNLEMHHESPRESYFQALLSRGDRRVGNLLYETEMRGKDWKWLLRQSGQREVAETFGAEAPSMDFYVYRRIPYEEMLPWEVVDSGIDHALLRREALRAHAEEISEQQNQGLIPVLSDVSVSQQQGLMSAEGIV